MATSREIQIALANAVKTIKVANGYAQNIPDTHVFGIANPYQHGQSATLSDYPRVFVSSDGAEYDDLPSNRIQKKEVFTVIAEFAKAPSDAASVLELAVANFIEDFEQMVSRNKQLGGSDYVQLQACADDLGLQDNDAVVVFQLIVIFRRRF